MPYKLRDDMGGPTMTATRLRPAIFFLDCVNRTFDGFTSGETWNGFACPYFTREQGEELAQAWRERGWTAHYDERREAFLFGDAVDPGDAGDARIEEFSALDIDGTPYFPIGARYWSWDDARGRG
jgi:hypothetical protein